jgi:hypothetical protein
MLELATHFIPFSDVNLKWFAVLGCPRGKENMEPPTARNESTDYDAARSPLKVIISIHFPLRVCAAHYLVPAIPAGPFSGSPRGGGEICLGGRRGEGVNGQAVLIRVYINMLGKSRRLLLPL